MQNPIKKRGDLTALTEAVEKMHGAKAVFVTTQSVHEEFQGKTVWQGTVSIFDLFGHLTASKCYAWSASSGDKERFYAVLHTEVVDTPEKAVRASIISERRAAK